ncbi:7-cyano-7-deazaguanine synthase QueC [Gammaproteobacteria bacterium]|nr:7-cyano-7-deazaguanine synthase QueC [Gammaproteobacteria bacterium]
MKKILVIYSGGLDSYTLLNEAIFNGHEVEAITFNYGQKHKVEVEYASKFCSDHKIPHEIVNLNLERVLSDSALVGDTKIPEGNYDKDKMMQTIVPNRNMIMISVAASQAIKNKCEHLWYAAHAGDHEIYPDCRPEFIDKLGAVLSICDYHEIKFEAPYMKLSKNEIVKKGLEMNLNYAQAWTCYVGGKKPCLKCSSCLERASAFKFNEAEDPLNEI